MRRMRCSAIMFLLVCAAICLVCADALGSSRGRAFEQVSPLYKGGAGATVVEGVSQDGESVAYFAPDAFEGAPTGLTQNIDGLDYLARRTPSGWHTVPVTPPASLTPVALGANRDISSDATITTALGALGPNNESAQQEGREEGFFVHATSSPDTVEEWKGTGVSLALIGKGALRLRYMGASQDFCHFLFDEFTSFASSILTKPEVLLEAAAEAKPQLYELDRGCGGGSPALRLVAVDNQNKPVGPGCRPNLGIESFGERSAALQAFNAISADGRTIFFTACINNNESEHQLFVRLGASKTLEVSKSTGENCGGEIPCPQASKRPSAEFVGASEGGSIVYFMTRAGLSLSDTDNGNDLYMARVGCPGAENCAITERRVTELVQVSHDPSGAEADVQGTVRIVPDGSRAYFVATGDLLSPEEMGTLEQEGRAVPQIGADNLYVYDAGTGKVQFVSALCSGFGASGTTEDRYCSSKEHTDSELWTLINGNSEAQTAGKDGRYLVFSSYGQLTSDDADAAKDVYRYDAAANTLDRVSDGEDGHHANGNSNGEDASILTNWFGEGVRHQLEMDSRTISEDGSRVIFESAEPLSPGAINHLVNIYEWHKNADSAGGTVSLVSGGDGTTPVEDAVISPSGRDVFFATSEGLVPQDTDNAPDIYDARLGGGFASAPAAPERCSGDACQGPLTNPAPLLVPSTVSQPAGEEFSAPSKSVKTVIVRGACSRGYVRNKRGKCVKVKKKRRKARPKGRKAAIAPLHGRATRMGG